VKRLGDLYKDLVIEGVDSKATPGEVSFTVKTVTDGGNYAPKHVLAIWVEDANGFVKTRKVLANQRIQYLYTWKVSSNYNDVDAITGPTINSHQTHTVTWDCRDLEGAIVPDGDYNIYAEFTEKHAQGPVTMVTFTKGPDAQVLDPADEDHFINMHLEYTAFVGIENITNKNEVGVFPNPSTGYIQFTNIDSETQVSVFDMKGVLVGDYLLSKENISLDLNDLTSGIYMLRLNIKGEIVNQKLIIR